MKMNVIKTTASGIKFTLRHPALTLSVIIIMTACAGYGLKNIKIAADPLVSMYPISHSYIPTLNAIKKMTPFSPFIVCVLEVKKGDIYNSETLKKIDNITKGLLNIDGIMPDGITTLTRGMMHYYNTAYGLNIESVMGTMWPRTPEEFEALKRRVAINPMGLGRFVAYDGTAVMITAQLADINTISQKAYDEIHLEARPPFDKFKRQQSARFNAKLVNALENLKMKEDDAGHTLLFMGEEILTHQLTRMGMTHIGTAAAVMCIITFLLLFFYFRSISGVVIPFITMAVTITWTLGLYGWTGIEFNPLMILFPIILALLALSVGTLLMGEYTKARISGLKKNDCIQKAFSHLPIRRVIFTAGLIIFGMAVPSVPVLRALAAMGLFWIIGAYMAVVLLCPALLLLMPGPSLISVTTNYFSVFFEIFSGSWNYSGLIIGLILLLGGPIAYTHLEIGNNVPGASYIRINHPWNRCFSLLSEKFMGPQQLLVYVKADKTGGLVDPAAMNAIENFSHYLISECNARDSIAFDMMIKMCRWTLMDGNPKWMTLPMTRNEVEGIAGTVFEQGGVDSFIDQSFTEATISPFFPSSDSADINTYAAKMQAYIDTHPTPGIKFMLGGGLLGMTKPQNDATRFSYPRIILVSMTTLLFLGMVFFSPLKGIAVTLSVVCAQIVIWFVMIILGIKVSMGVVSVTAASIAMGFIIGSGKLDITTTDSATFVGVLVFFASLPFSFIGMKFQADMLLIFSAFVAAEVIIGVFIIPFFIGGTKKYGKWTYNI